MVKNLPAHAKVTAFDPWVRNVPWSRKWQPTPASLPGKFHGQRSLEGYSLRGRKESGTTEHTCAHAPHVFMASYALSFKSGSEIDV